MSPDRWYMMSMIAVWVAGTATGFLAYSLEDHIYEEACRRTIGCIANITFQGNATLGPA